MAAGFQVFAADGSNVLQIDSEGGLPNFQLKQKMSQTTGGLSFTNSQIADGTYYRTTGFGTTFTFNAVSPMAVFECNNDWIVPHLWTRNGNTFSVQVLSRSNGANVNLYVFDQASSAIAVSNFGLQVFNAGGTLVADISQPFVKPVGFGTGNPKYAVGQTGYTTDGGLWNEDQGVLGFPVPQRVGIACVEPAFAVGGASGAPSNAGVYLSMHLTQSNGVNTKFVSCGDNSRNNNFTGFREQLTFKYMAVDISYL